MLRRLTTLRRLPLLRRATAAAAAPTARGAVRLQQQRSPLQPRFWGVRAPTTLSAAQPLPAGVLQPQPRRAMSTGAAADDKRESMDFDVVVVGAGPAGLGAAIRLKQLAKAANRELSVCVVEKGAEIGSHILSGNVFEPQYLAELFPDWKARGAPLHTPVTSDQLLFLTHDRAVPLWPTPPTLDNHGNYIISLGSVVRWLATQAQELGVELYPGFAASEVLHDPRSGAVVGIATNDQGVSKKGERLPTFQRGMELRAQQTLFAEGARGSLSERVIEKFGLRADCDPQHYGLGLKEVWELAPGKHQAGSVTHTFGWPMDAHTYGGSFLYHATNPDVLLIGYVVGLDYANPYLSPYEEFQRFKQHPAIRPLLDGGKCIAYGARVINEGGYQSIPRLTFPGGALLGCSAGFVNLPKIKGSHNALKSGMTAAEALFARFQALPAGASLAGADVVEYETAMRDGPVFKELKEVRNIAPAFHYFGGLVGWAAYSAFELFVARGRVPWTLRNTRPDSAATEPAALHTPIAYPRPDNTVSFDLLTNLARSGVNHAEDQPAHLRVRPGMERTPIVESFDVYAGPEGRFCPAKVYEYVTDDATGQTRLQINAQNCVHCKTCDIKPVRNFIRWTVPEGGGGPAYEAM